MAERKVQVFFYGTHMAMEAIEAAGLKRRAFAPASIQGFELTITPLATLSEAGDGIVYGILANFTHAELDTLYHVSMPLMLGHQYLPEPIIVHTRGGKVVPAFTYICHDMKKAEADPEYVTRLQKQARAYGFPNWYLDHIGSFAA